MKDYSIPINVGRGSQPPDSDGAEMDFMELPSGMTTFMQPIIPEADEVTGLSEALELSEKILDVLRKFKAEDLTQIIELNNLDMKNRDFFDQLLGEGEVSVQSSGDTNALIQESVLAGVWRVQYINEEKQIVRDTIEIGIIPSVVTETAFINAAENVEINFSEVPESVYNAPPLLTEINDNLKSYKVGDEAHVVNLSLLPHTENDLMFLSDKLGIGPIIILSRGYGNCRISSTATNYVWWVQYFNSQDTLILNTIEVSKVPEVACASQEDIDDSAERLSEILSIYK